MAGPFLKDTPTEVILGHSVGMRRFLKAVAVSATIFLIYLSWEQPAAIVFTLLFGSWVWKVADERKTIEFNRPPGFMTITYYRFLGILGAWPWLKESKQLPLSEAYRAATDVTRAFVRISQDRIAETKRYDLRVPAGNGTSFHIWGSTDPEVIRHLASRITEAAEKSADLSQ